MPLDHYTGHCWRSRQGSLSILSAGKLESRQKLGRGQLTTGSWDLRQRLLSETEQPHTAGLGRARQGAGFPSWSSFSRPCVRHRHRSLQARTAVHASPGVGLSSAAPRKPGRAPRPHSYPAHPSPLSGLGHLLSPRHAYRSTAVLLLHASHLRSCSRLSRPR